MRKEPIIYPLAFLAGIISEFIGFQVEQWMIRFGVPARIGFPVSLLVFVFFPFLTTGVIVYKTTRNYVNAIILSTVVIPATLALIKFLGI